MRAMREGRWIVFEDIDRGSSDVLGVIKPLIESLHPGKWIGGRAVLEIPSRGRIVAADSFSIFATRSITPLRSGDLEVFPSATFFGAHKLFEISVPSPSSEELNTIIDARFPRLAGPIARAIISLWKSVRDLGTAASSREIGVRELEKYCTRIHQLLPVSSSSQMDVDMDPGGEPSLLLIFSNPSLREDMYLEARDVFFGAGTLTSAARTHSEQIAEVVGEHLGLDKTRQKCLLHERTPDYLVETDVNGNASAVNVGRVRLRARSGPRALMETARPFATHRPARALLARIGAAVSLVEPVLLTGETGTGKTSVISHLASTLNRPLISLNLSHQTESSDLLGGFKPIDARVPASELQERWMGLFSVTFSRKRNEKFETEVRKAVLEGKWKRAAGLWKESTRMAREKLAKITGQHDLTL